MINPGRYNVHRFGDGEPPSSPVGEVVASARDAQSHDAAFPSGLRSAHASSGALNTVHGATEPPTVTREEREAQTTEAAGGPNHPQFYTGFPGPRGSGDSDGAPATGNNCGAGVPAAAAAVDEEETIEQMLSKVIIHQLKPIENLPQISPPELKIIGRAVTFKGETRIGDETVMMHYEGLVGTINKDTVMLIHVHRFTEEDYQIHKIELTEQPEQDDKSERNREKPEQVTSAEASAAVEAACSPTTAEAHGQTPSPPGITEADGLDMRRDASAASPSPYLPNAVTGNDHSDTNLRVRNRLRNNTGSMGPIPYMTFSRSRIHQVDFARDPRSTFYSLFRDPTKEFFDMQCLRMFCRRYVVHTSQGNNPRGIPLRPFVSCRCNCPDLDEELLLRVTREEIAHLVKIDRDAKRVKKRKDSSRRNVLRMYQAPAGIFRSTGVLYLTQIPRQTFILGFLECLLALILAFYAAGALSRSEPTFVRGYVTGFVPYIIPAIVLGSLSGVYCIIHGVRMTLPLSRNLLLASCRVIAVTAALAANLMMMITVGQSFKPTDIRTAFASLPLAEACYLFGVNQCLGFDEVNCTQDDPGSSGGGGNSSARLWSTGERYCGCEIARFMSPGQYPPCGSRIVATVEAAMIPLVCFSLVLFILLWFDHFLHYKLFYVGRLLARRM